MVDSDRDERIREHAAAAWARAAAIRDEARALNEAGHHSAAFVWAVPAAEALMRDFVLAPHFMEEGQPWDEAMRQGSKVLGSSSWQRAFSRAEEWYGPFDEPRTGDERNAWSAWKGDYLRRRGGLIHGEAVFEADDVEASNAIDFADTMATWYSLRLTFNLKHPIGRRLFALFEEAKGDQEADGD